MKIGILTFHRAHNYGAVLQCYALQEVLKSMGHDVWVIDYRQSFIESKYSPFSFLSVKEYLFRPITLLRYLKHYFNRKERLNTFHSFTEKFLHKTQPCNKNIPLDFEAYIIGSDQVWSWDCVGNIKDPIYLGNFPHPQSSKIIGYAISTNMASLKRLSNDELNKALHNFSLISMREQFAIDYIVSKTNILPYLCLDPTLLTSEKDWTPLINDEWKSEKYILVYQVRYPKGKQTQLIQKAQSLANRYNCKIIDLSNVKFSVENFVSLFKYAEYVVTTSFHATVFSIIFNTPFYAIKLNDGHDGRYENLLNLIGLSKCCVDINTDLEPQIIDFESVKKKMVEYKSESISFLSKI